MPAMLERKGFRVCRAWTAIYVRPTPTTSLSGQFSGGRAGRDRLTFHPFANTPRIGGACQRAERIEEHHDDGAFFDRRFHDETLPGIVGEAGLLHQDVPVRPAHEQI